MRILITGGFGFVGGRLARHLMKSGNKIILGTRHLVAPPDWLPHAEVEITAWDDESALERICVGVDVIIHAAGMNSEDCAMDPIAALAFNGYATLRLVTAAARMGVRKFIYLSTANVYNSPLAGVITEESCLHNMHPYATSHLAGERAVLSANARSALEGNVLRLSNAFGVPMHKDVNCWMLVVNDLCKQAVQARKLVLKTSGLQQRDFISLDNVSYVLERLVTQTSFKQVNLFNVGVGTSQSVLEIAQLIQQRCNKVLGFLPEIQRNQSETSEHHPSFIYRTGNLNSLGIACNGFASVDEIDNLLQFCWATFRQREGLMHE